MNPPPPHPCDNSKNKSESFARLFAPCLAKADHDRLEGSIKLRLLQSLAGYSGDGETKDETNNVNGQDGTTSTDKMRQCQRTKWENVNGNKTGDINGQNGRR